MKTPETSNSVASYEFGTIRRRLVQAGIGNVSTTIIEGYGLQRIPLDQDLDPHLHLNLLHIAAWTGDVDTVRDLKRQNLADPAAATAGGFTALHLAASRGYSHVLNELLTWPGVDVRGAISVEGFTPLHLAAHGGYQESVKLLVHSSDINAKDEVFGRTALHFAAQGGYEEILEILNRVSDVQVRSKDKVRELTPFLLAAMQPCGQCSLRLVTMLLDADVNQINDKVGILTEEMANEVVSTHSNQPWRVLAPIEIDSSVKPTPDVDDEVEEKELDLYRKFAVPMEGHSALHLGATQNNAALVSHLVRRPGVLLNEGDDSFGMTPLHCAIRTSAMEAFSALMEVDQVNASAKLVRAGFCQRPSWLPPASAFYLEDESNDMFVRQFARLDTPFHLAIRVCRAEHLQKMVAEFCNHPMFNPAIQNEFNLSALDVAWIRYSYCARTPSFAFRIQGSIDSKVVKDYVQTDGAHLNHILDVLERQPTTADIMSAIAGRRKVVQDSWNASLVTATLVAGLTFSAYLQPPFGTNVGEYRSKPARLFWTFNALSFYFAVYTILRCLLSIMRGDPRWENGYLFSGQLAILRFQGAVPLTLSVGLAMGAFVAAGYGNLPPEGENLMLACAIIGLLLVVFQLLRNLYVAFSTVMEVLFVRWDDVFGEWKRLFTICVVLGGPFTLVFLFFGKCCLGRKGTIRTHKFTSIDYTISVPFVVTQLYVAVAVVLYAVIDVLR